MTFEDLLRRLRYLDCLSVADEGEHGALAVGDMLPTSAMLIWMGCPVSSLVH